MQKKKCPVCDWEIEGAGIVVEAGGKKVVVCCDECATKARAAAKPKR